MSKWHFMTNIKITYPPKTHLECCCCRLFIFVFQRVISRAKTTTTRKNDIKSIWMNEIYNINCKFCYVCIFYIYYDHKILLVQSVLQCKKGFKFGILARFSLLCLTCLSSLTVWGKSRLIKYNFPMYHTSFELLKPL
jgi:hypothetical protein